MQQKNVQCALSDMCSRPNCHTRECDENLKSKKMFWTNSPIFMKKTLLGDVHMLQAKKAKLDSSNEIAATAAIEIKTLREQKLDFSGQMNEMSSQINEMNEDYQNLKFIIDSTSQGKTKRVKNPTTNEMVNDSSCSTRYVRRNETKDVLEYIHGGADGAVFGSFDFLKNIWRNFFKKTCIKKWRNFFKKTCITRTDGGISFSIQKREVYPKAPWEIFKHFQEFCRWDEASNCHKIQASFV